MEGFGTNSSLEPKIKHKQTKHSGPALMSGSPLLGVDFFAVDCKVQLDFTLSLCLFFVNIFIF